MNISVNISNKTKFRKEMSEYLRNLPRFPDGRLDYSQSPKAPVISCFLEFNGQILLLKRSTRVGYYPGVWGVITGFLDRSDLGVVETAQNELKEEIGVSQDEIKNLFVGESYEFKDETLENKTWIIYPILVKLERKPKVTLDWENEKYVWTTPSDLDKYETLPGLKKSLSKVLKFI